MPGVAERTITGSRGKALGFLLGSLAFTAVAIWLVRQPGGADWRLWCGIALFGLCSGVFAWMLVRPQRLGLDAAGFTVSGGLVRTPRATRWADIDGFFVYRLPRGGRMIGFNYAPGARPPSALRALNRLAGADGALPRGWPGSPERMAAELNAYRAAALAVRAGPAPVAAPGGFGRKGLQ